MSTPTAEGRSPGKVTTFYSFKGGTGRSMAAANTACLLADPAKGRRVLLMDWDLEAPGLHRYFANDGDLKGRGLIDYFVALEALLEKKPELYPALQEEDGWQKLDEALPLADFVRTDVVEGVDLMMAGALDADYITQIRRFHWAGFFEKYHAVFDAFRDLTTARYAHAIVDSRTGLTDVGGICTMILPEQLVAVFTPNHQSLQGAVDAVSRAIAYRRSSNDLRPLTVFPLAGRIELAEQAFRRVWRRRYQREFEKCLGRGYELGTCDLTKYFDEIQIPHVSRYAYGERISVRTERDEAYSLSRGYRAFVERIVSSTPAWSEPPPRASGDVTEPLTRDVDVAIAREHDAIRLVSRPAASWRDGGKPGTSLLRGDELAEAMRWARSADSLEAGEIEFLIASCEASLQERERDADVSRAELRSGKRYLWSVLGALGVTLVAVAALNLWREQNQAADARVVIGQLETQVQHLQNDQADLTLSLKEAVSRASALDKQATDAQAKVDAQAKAVEKAKAVYDAESKNRNVAQARLDQLKAQLDLANNLLTQTRQDADDAKAAAVSAQALKETMQRQIDDANNAKAATQIQLSKLTADAKSAQDVCNNALSDLRNQLDQAKRATASCQSDQRQWQQRQQQQQQQQQQ